MAGKTDDPLFQHAHFWSTKQFPALLGGMRLWGLVLVLSTGTLAQTITVFDPPNSSETHPQSINARGEITGLFLDTSTSTNRGFVRDPKGVITVFDAPASSSTVPRSINARGEITGWFVTTTFALTRRGFVRDPKGAFTVFDAPNTSFTFPSSINARGDIAGSFFAGGLRGFVRQP